MKPGAPVRKIGAVIHALADELGYGVVEKFVGHGVGREFHSGPTVRHHRNNDAGTLRVGQTFTIEPMLTIGKTADAMWKDGWTAVTKDGKWTAQCEHTLLVTETGVEILTASPKGLWGPPCRRATNSERGRGRIRLFFREMTYVFHSFPRESLPRPPTRRDATRRDASKRRRSADDRFASSMTGHRPLGTPPVVVGREGASSLRHMGVRSSLPRPARARRLLGEALAHRSDERGARLGFVRDRFRRAPHRSRPRGVVHEPAEDVDVELSAHAPDRPDVHLRDGGGETGVGADDRSRARALLRHQSRLVVVLQVVDLHRARDARDEHEPGPGAVVVQVHRAQGEVAHLGSGAEEARFEA